MTKIEKLSDEAQAIYLRQMLGTCEAIQSSPCHSQDAKRFAAHVLADAEAFAENRLRTMESAGRVTTESHA